jgi:Cys-tRNA(Pro)/Cys-tRNA(Cys) deacylase
MAGCDDKTNVMRYLDKSGIRYIPHIYAEMDQTATGSEIARHLGEDPLCVFKTLVTMGKSERCYIFIIPVDSALDLKKAAAAVGEKSVHMLPVKDLQRLTGYVHGGCSPMCMTRRMPALIDITAESKETVYVSAGKVGYQVELSYGDLKKAVPGLDAADICQ